MTAGCLITLTGFIWRDVLQGTLVIQRRPAAAPKPSTSPAGGVAPPGEPDVGNAPAGDAGWTTPPAVSPRDAGPAEGELPLPLHEQIEVTEAALHAELDQLEHELDRLIRDPKERQELELLRFGLSVPRWLKTLPDWLAEHDYEVSGAIEVRLSVSGEKWKALQELLSCFGNGSLPDR